MILLTGFFRTGSPDLVVVVVAVALVVTIIANSAILAVKEHGYKWWYGLIKLGFYFGSFALSLFGGGITTAIASISTFLGMELNKLSQLMHIYGIIPNRNHAFRTRKSPEGRKDTAEN